MSSKLEKVVDSGEAPSYDEEEANMTEEEAEVYVTDDEEGEVEVTDDEAEGTEEHTSVVNVSPPQEKAEATKKADNGKKATGKVKPSEKVKNMKMKTPAGGKGHSVGALNPDKSPFAAFGDWTPETLDQIDVAFPILTGKNETTNELTRSTKPEARYWKAPIAFKFGNFVSESIRVNNVHIPFHSGKGYGSSYVYLCLPGFMGDAFSDAGKKRAPTRVHETSLVPDNQRWWKIANKVEGAFGVIKNKMFVSKSLETIFEATNSGITCAVILNFKCKAATTEKEALRPTTARTVAVEVVRAYITQTDINVQMPTRINREKVKVAPVASSADVATDSLLGRLAELGL